MGFGKLRFSRSFGQVKSQFRGAIPKHFPLVQNLLDLYPATAAYSAYDLGNKRGSVTEAEGTVVNPVQRWRRSSDDALQMFTANDIASGTALDFVVPTDVQALYGDRMYFDGVDDYVSLDSPIQLAIGEFIEATAPWMTGNRIYMSEDTAIGVDFLTLTNSGVAAFRVGGTIYTHTGVAVSGESNTVRLTRTAESTYSLSLNGSSESFSTTNVAIVLQEIGGSSNVPAYYKGVYTDINYNNVSRWDGTGLVTWIDTEGSNNGTVVGSPSLFTGQGYDAYLLTEYDQSGNGYDLTQTTAANQPLVVSGGALTVDGVASYSALFDGVNDDLDFTGTFTGLTAANVYAITDNAGTVTLDTLTAQNITAVTTLDGLLASLTYDHVTFVAIYPDATDQAAIQAQILTQFSVT